jgi:hypothetical protein
MGFVVEMVTFRGPSGEAQQASFADFPWWEIFKDETLKELVKMSLTFCTPSATTRSPGLSSVN